MKTTLLAGVALSLLAASCTSRAPLKGTWRLISGTTITKGVSVVTDYTKGQKFIKIVGDTHFSFLRHDLNPAKDSSSHFDGGGGRYTLTGDKYTEYLDFYTDHNWEGKSFDFTVSFVGDTLIQRGRETNAAEGIDREIIEKYVKETE
ncbi:MAG TPA: hypothetical protein VL547_08275 [Dinghuibacter sp.]|uniref:hypothetical protein n=1 Tax=Dinghuibacter sp. TaxID=2024697 RepID=UPI002B53FFB0|nr:hypothetical protein [Dinghuibacter sp.]HTJ12006.1 hypothetical protein [Dinghuibacter sp.]